MQKEFLLAIFFKKYKEDYGAILKYIQSYAGFDGGSLEGDIWVFGLEWGSPINENWSTRESNHFSEIGSLTIPSWPKESYRYIKGKPFNIKAAKLVSILEGYPLDSYMDYTKEDTNRELFTINSNTLKLSLFPFRFNNVSDRLWLNAGIDGVESKSKYRELCRKFRFPRIKKLANRYQPKIILCFGTTYANYFKDVFLPEPGKFQPNRILPKLSSGNKVEVNDLSYGAKLFICPHFSGAKGLNSDIHLSELGKLIMKEV